MSALSDPANRTTNETNDSHAGFFKAKLDLCFTFADIAETNFRICHSESGENAMSKAELGCATAQRLLSDPEHANHLADEEIRKITVELERLRARIAEVRQRFAE